MWSESLVPDEQWISALLDWLFGRFPRIVLPMTITDNAMSNTLRCLNLIYLLLKNVTISTISIWIYRKVWIVRIDCTVGSIINWAFRLKLIWYRRQWFSIKHEWSNYHSIEDVACHRYDGSIVCIHVLLTTTRLYEVYSNRYLAWRRSVGLPIVRSRN